MSPESSSRRIGIGVASILSLLPITPAVSFEFDIAAIGGRDNTTQATTPHGESLAYGVDAGIGESDNVTLVESNKVSQTIAIADADLEFKERSRLFDADLKGNFSYLDYLQNAYANQLIGRFDGIADVALIPGRMTWDVQENFGQGQIDPFTATTPTNLQNINYVSTGPDLHLKLGPTFFLDMTARYARATYQTDPFDSNRLLGSVALGLPLSAQSGVSLNGSFLRVLFDDTATNTDFNRSSAYGHYEISGARTDLTASLGVTKVDEGGQSMTGPLARLELSRRLSAAQKLKLAFVRDQTDASTGFSTLQSGAAGGIVTAPAAVTLTNYTLTYGSVTWEYTRNRTILALSGTWEKDSYDNQPQQDLTRGTAQFKVERQLSRVLTAQIIGSVYHTEYTNTDFSETDGLIGAALTYREGRGLEIRLRYEHSSRVVSEVGSGYTENRAFLTIGYRPRVGQPN
jgi:Putative beta-barrel porin 2